MIVLIPAYQPGRELITLVAELANARPDPVSVSTGARDSEQLSVLIVNDGSDASYAAVFDEAQRLGARVISCRHNGVSVNRGKGFALKLGFAHIIKHFPGQVVVCADADGQHSVNDILRVANATTNQPAPVSQPTLVLGEREFTGSVPFRSRFGNCASRVFFALATGSWLRDTQTGLRGFSADLLPWLCDVEGERYEYELNVLLEAQKLLRRGSALNWKSVPIATIYLDQNGSSHFRPIRDSARIYAPLLRFAASSFSGFLLDLLIFTLLVATSGSLLLAVVVARVISGGVNFMLNRSLVFNTGNAGPNRVPLRKAITNYTLLALALVAANYLLLLLLTGLGLWAFPAKVLTELLLFCTSFAVQKSFADNYKKSQPLRSEHSQRSLEPSTYSAQESAEV